MVFVTNKKTYICKRCEIRQNVIGIGYNEISDALLENYKFKRNIRRESINTREIMLIILQLQLKRVLDRTIQDNFMTSHLNLCVKGDYALVEVKGTNDER